MVEGYKRKVNIDRFKSIDLWRQTRLISYFIARNDLKDKNISIYNFYPLPDDPTDEDIKRAAEQEHEQDAKWMKEVINKHRKTKGK